MTSKVLNGAAAAENSFPQQHAQKSKTNKISPLYTQPMKASHPNDTSQRRPKKQLQNQFAKTACSFSPPPSVDVTNWGSTNTLLLFEDNMGLPRRFSRPPRNRNITSSAAAQSTKVNINVFIGNCGKPTMKNMLWN